MTLLLQFLGIKESGPVFSYELVKGIVENGEEVYTVLHSDVENKEKWIDLLGKDHIFFFSHWIEKKHPFTSIIRFSLDWIALKRKFRNVHFQYSIRPFVSIYDNLLFGAVNCNKIVNFCHDPIPHSGISKVDAEKNKNLINKADKIVVLTKSFIPIVEREYKKNRKDIIFVRHGILPYSKNNKQKTIFYDESKCIHFVFFGRIDPYKGLDVLSTAFSKLSKGDKMATLTIAGNGDLKNYIDDVHHLSNVEIINRYIKDDEVDFLFSAPNIVLVIPYKDATQSGVVSIAYEYSIPVIATDTGGLKEQLFDGEVGVLVEVNSASSLFKAMDRFVWNPSLYEEEVLKMSKYKEELSWNVIANKLISEIRA